MELCQQCHDVAPKVLGSGPYHNDRLCLRCYYDWYQAKTKAEDFQKFGNYAAQAAAHHAAQAPPHQARAGEPGATPVWRLGRNVVVRQKPCDRCGVPIHIRKNAKGVHYPSDVDGPRPHDCQPAGGAA